MRLSHLIHLFMVLLPVCARRDGQWDSKFDIPSGFRSYQAQRDTGRSPSIDDLSYGFEGFLDEGLESDVQVRGPSHEHHRVPEAHHSAHTPVAPHQHHHHSGQHHSHHHGHHQNHVAFLEIETTNQPKDAALEEAERDFHHVADTQVAVEHAIPAVAPPQPISNTPLHNSNQPDRPFDFDDSQTQLPEQHKSAPAAQPKSEEIPTQNSVQQMVDHADSSIPQIKTIDEFRQQVKMLEQAILSRPDDEQSVTELISDAAKTGQIMKLIPRVPIRTGLQPGILPGLVDTASTSAAFLQPLIGNSLASNVKAVSELQLHPEDVRQLQSQLPQVMPDSPQLHPLQKMRQAIEAANHADQNPLVPVADGVPAMLEVSQGATKPSKIREDQVLDLQYLRGIGQGVETLAMIFGAASPELQKQALEMSSALKSMGSDFGDSDVSFLELSTAMHRLRGTAPLAPEGGEYRDPPAWPRQSQQVAGASFKQPPDSMLAPSTFPVSPASPQLPNPTASNDELSWMLNGYEAKGYGGSENPAQRLDLNRLFQSLKGFLNKGKKIRGEDSDLAAEDKASETDGFGGWPQPFWWTRPPSWLDDVPGWMQRLQMKKSLHKSAAFN
eukprot:c9176_g1_i1.p1 GENE.c9176_g1_i1~~c9176_g1_i1.p1  ORF type:complete len:610 (-),score=135.57 c9176_g1_i1:120-1949(-)